MKSNQLACALVAASDFNAGHFVEAWEKGRFSSIVAVDGGLMHLELVGCHPDFTLGDFDSLGYVPAGENVQVHSTHKDQSDLELAFDHVIGQAFDEIVVYGALGGRLDHTMAALQVGARYAETGVDVTFIGLDYAVRILVGPAMFTLPLRDCGTVSVFSAVDESLGVSEWGMEYPLEDVRLSNRTTLGLSNELKGEAAGVKLDHGTLYVFFPL